MKEEKKKDISELTDHLGYWIRMVSNHVSYSFAKKLDAVDVTVAEWVILREMYGNEHLTNPSSFAERTGLTRGAVSKLISRLLEKGFVIRHESKEDKRYQDVKLTEKAYALVPKLAHLADKNDDSFFSILDEKEREQLKKLLMKIVERHAIKTPPLE